MTTRSPSLPDPYAERNASESEAIAVALNGSRLDRAAVAARALAGLWKNSEDTTQVLRLGIAVNAGKFKDVLARFAIDPGGAQLLEDRPSIDSRHVDFDRLRALPDGTLGREYVRFLDDGGLDADFFQAPPGLPPLLAYLAQRVRQSHDVWHVVTGFSSEPSGEIGLQAFTWRQMRMPSALIITLFGVIRHGVTQPQTLAEVARGLRLAKGATWLPGVRWEDHWERPLDVLRVELGLAS